MKIGFYGCVRASKRESRVIFRYCESIEVPKSLWKSETRQLSRKRKNPNSSKKLFHSRWSLVILMWSEFWSEFLADESLGACKTHTDTAGTQHCHNLKMWRPQSFNVSWSVCTGLLSLVNNPATGWFTGRIMSFCLCVRVLINHGSVWFWFY